MHGFFYHFSDIETGKRVKGVELSSIDTSLLLCGVLTARAYFDDAKIKSLATQIYERVDWPWMLNGGKTFSMGWHPENGFLDARWEHYCELMMIYLLAIGSPTHPVRREYWNNLTRPVIHYDGLYATSAATTRSSRISTRTPGSISATSVTSTPTTSRTRSPQPRPTRRSVSPIPSGTARTTGAYPHRIIRAATPHGEARRRKGRFDGTVVPCAAAGSLAFVPGDCLSVLRAMRDKWGKQAWGRYGFVDAFHPAANWYDPDVLGIDQGISVLMAENLRTGLIWNTFMRNPEAKTAMQRAGFHTTA